jgi:tetratricopeptide (TPR) repeat protein
MKLKPAHPNFSVSAFQYFSFCLLLLASCVWPSSVSGLSADALFQAGVTAYRASDYAGAAEAFSQSITLQPASGTLQNLGNAEWQRHRTGAAILAWEQALWLDPFNQSARQNLRYARKNAQLEAPDLAWYEVISTWLPVTWWAWIAGVSLWLSVGIVLLPGILQRRKATWHQAIAALGLMVFLLSVPAHIGVETRSRIGFVMQKDTPLRLTPTLEAQAVTRLAAGEPARKVRARGNYLLIRNGRVLGWVEQDQFGLTCPKPGGKAGQTVKVATAR